MNRRTFLTASILAPLCGCGRTSTEKAGASIGGGSTTPTADAAKSDELEFAYSIQKNTDKGPEAISEDYPFPSGTRFRFLILTKSPAHIYALDMGPKQKSYKVLFPNVSAQQENPVSSGSPVTIPGGETWLKMDKIPGHERFVLVVSTHPLEEFNTTETDIPRDEVDERVSAVERLYRPASSRRFVDKEWVKWFFAKRPDKTAMVLRLPLLHS